MQAQPTRLNMTLHDISLKDVSIAYEWIDVCRGHVLCGLVFCSLFVSSIGVLGRVGSRIEMLRMFGFAPLAV